MSIMEVVAIMGLVIIYYRMILTLTVSVQQSEMHWEIFLEKMLVQPLGTQYKTFWVDCLGTVTTVVVGSVPTVAITVLGLACSFIYLFVYLFNITHAGYYS